MDKIRELIESLFGVDVKNVLEAADIDETVESDALLAREAGAALMEDYDDEPLYVMEIDGGGFVSVGSGAAILMMPDNTLEIKDLPTEEEQAEMCAAHKKKKKKMQNAVVFKTEDEDEDEDDEDTLEERKRRKMKSGQKAKMLRSRKTQTGAEKKKNIKRRKGYKKNRLKIARLRKRVTSSDNQAYYLIDAQDDERFLNLLTDEQVEALDIDDSGDWLIPEEAMGDDAELLATGDEEELSEDNMDETYAITKDGKVVAKGLKTENAAYAKLQKIQGQSWDYAIKHGGYKVVKESIESEEQTDTVVAFLKTEARDFLRFVNRVKLEESPSIATHGDYMYVALPSTVAEALEVFFEATYVPLKATKEEAIVEALVRNQEEGDTRIDIVSKMMDEMMWVTKKLAESGVKTLIEQQVFTLNENVIEVDREQLDESGAIPRQGTPMPKIPYDVGPGSMDKKRPTFSQSPRAPKKKVESDLTTEEFVKLVQYLGEDMLKKLSKPQVAQIKDETPAGLKALGKMLKGKSDAECKALLSRTLGESEEAPDFNTEQDDDDVPIIEGEEIQSPSNGTALSLFDYHGGTNSAVYQVGSAWLAEKCVDISLVKKALTELLTYTEAQEELDEDADDLIEILTGLVDEEAPDFNDLEEGILKDDDLKGLKKWVVDMNASGGKMAKSIKSNIDKKLKSLGLSGSKMKSAYKLIGMAEGADEPGKRDGTGPFKGGLQAKKGKGKRKAAGEKCLVEDVRLVKTQEDIANVPGDWMDAGMLKTMLAKLPEGHAFQIIKSVDEDDEVQIEVKTVKLDEGMYNYTVEQKLLRKAVDTTPRVTVVTVSGAQVLEDGDIVGQFDTGSDATKAVKSLGFAKRGKKWVREDLEENLYEDYSPEALMKVKNAVEKAARKKKADGVPNIEGVKLNGEGTGVTVTLKCSKDEVQGFIKALRACGATDDAEVVIEGDEVKITVEESVAERVKALMEG